MKLPTNTNTNILRFAISTGKLPAKPIPCNRYHATGTHTHTSNNSAVLSWNGARKGLRRKTTRIYCKHRPLGVAKFGQIDGNHSYVPGQASSRSAIPLANTYGVLTGLLEICACPLTEPSGVPRKAFAQLTLRVLRKR